MISAGHIKTQRNAERGSGKASGKEAKPALAGPRIDSVSKIMNICRYCHQPVTETESVPTFSYWWSLEFLCHKACKEAGEKQEAFDCQIIDADCNDCRHYKRGKLAPKVVSKLKTPDNRWVEVTHQPNIIIGGHCLKFSRPTIAQPNKWSGLECFEHRRS